MSPSRKKWPLLVALLALALVPATSASARGTSKLKLVTASPANRANVAGTVRWSVKPIGARPSRIDFTVDGRVVSSRRSRRPGPQAYPGGLDTSRLADGAHRLTAVAYGPKGRKATASIVVAIDNGGPEGSAPLASRHTTGKESSDSTAKPAHPGKPLPEPQPAPETRPLPETQPAPETQPVPGAGSHPIYWGATIGSQLTGSQAPWDMNAVSSFEGMAGKPLSLVQFFQPFSNCASSPCTFYKFPKAPLENVRQHGAIPVLSWASQSIPTSMSQPDYQLSDVIAGRWDSDITAFAEAAKAWGHPFFLRFNWEMNGRWFPWSEGVNGNKAGEYVAAWRHVHDIFTSVGATNATWAWCPNVDYQNELQPLASLYPGDAYVDWTCLDGYNFGTNPAKPAGWKSFDQLYASTYKKITETIAPSKPMMIGEVGSSEYGGSKADWITDMLAKIPSAYPRIRALLWFDKPEGRLDWGIESSSSATSAFAKGISSSAYLGNAFGGLSTSSVMPAS